jgi:hypothetical protein
MAHFRENTSNRSAFWYLRYPFADLIALDVVVRDLALKNPLGCTPYMKAGRNHSPVEKVREMYTAKFVYEDAAGKQIGNGLDTYHSVEGYQYGIAAVISNMANVAAHGGKVRHVPDADHFSVTLKCHDPDYGLFFISISRERLTISSYSNDALLDRARDWANAIAELEGVKTPQSGRRKRGRPPRRSIRDT